MGVRPPLRSAPRRVDWRRSIFLLSDFSPDPRPGLFLTPQRARTKHGSLQLQRARLLAPQSREPLTSNVDSCRWQEPFSRHLLCSDDALFRKTELAGGPSSVRQTASTQHISPEFRQSTTVTSIATATATSSHTVAASTAASVGRSVFAATKAKKPNATAASIVAMKSCRLAGIADLRALRGS
jgi:hypothetical protein